MVYYHINKAIRYLESFGYRGRRAIFTRPLAVDAHGTRDDNSWYSPGLRWLIFATGGVDDAEDEAAAMGEGFSDYLAASWFEVRKLPALRPTVGIWDAIADGGAPPACGASTGTSRSSVLTTPPTADEHENGKIWSATLWEFRGAVGREIADRMIVESHFQLAGLTRFARGRGRSWMRTATSSGDGTWRRSGRSFAGAGSDPSSSRTGRPRRRRRPGGEDIKIKHRPRPGGSR